MGSASAAIATLTLSALACASTAHADIRLPHLVGDNMVLQRDAPITIGGVALKAGEYVFGYTHNDDLLSVHFNDAATGSLIGTTDAHVIAGSRRVASLRIWPPGAKALIQIGRFGIPYELGTD